MRAYFNDFFTTSGLQIAADAEGRVLGSTLVTNIANQDCGGNYLTVDALQAGEQTFSLAGITQPGSYRLYVTVSKDGQRLLTVPYYFIVQ